MTTSTQEDLGQIKKNILAGRSDLAGQVTQTRAELAEQQAKLKEIQQAQASKRNLYFQLHEEIVSLDAAAALAFQEAELAVGTSLEADRKAKLSEATGALTEKREEMATNQEALESDEAAEKRSQEQVDALEDLLNGLVKQDAEMAAIYGRYHQEHAENVKSDHLAQLAAIDGQLEIARKTMAQLEDLRNEHLRTMARDLAPWPQLCEQTLQEALPQPEDPPAVTLLQAQLREVEAKLAEAKRSQGQYATHQDPAGARYLPTISGYEREVQALTSRIELLRHKARQHAAAEMLRSLGIVSQPSGRVEAAPLVVVERVSPGITTQTGFGSESMARGVRML